MGTAVIIDRPYPPASGGYVVAMPVGAMRFHGLWDGAGLGNQAIVWARAAAVAAQRGATAVFVPPLQSKHTYLAELRLRRRLLRRGTPAVALAALRRGVRVTPSDYWACDEGKASVGGGVCFVPRNLGGLFFPGRQGLPAVRTMFDELLAGAATDWVRAESTKVAIHCRRGDFAASSVTVGAVNAQWPVEWYEQRALAVLRAAREAGRPVELRVYSDDLQAELDLCRRIERLTGCTPHECRPGSEALPRALASMRAADFVIPSASTLSLLAIVLSEARYVWHADHLLWQGGDGAFADPFCPDADIVDRLRAEAVEGASPPPSGGQSPWGYAAAGAVTGAEVERLMDLLDTPAPARGGDWSRDLVLGGAVPRPTPAPDRVTETVLSTRAGSPAGGPP